MSGYYTQKLSAQRLKRCYEIAPPRVRQYFEAETDFVVSRLAPEGRVLDLGCGYGRAASRLLKKAHSVVGIDTSTESLVLARESLGSLSGCTWAAMDAATLAFPARIFHSVACIQNGISAFKVDRRLLVEEALRVTRGGGKVFFSTYAASFWEDRLEWFRLQADEGLLGEIDETATGEGVIVCKDGFRAETLGPVDFEDLTAGLDVEKEIIEVDGSSLFCVLSPNG